MKLFLMNALPVTLARLGIGTLRPKESKETGDGRSLGLQHRIPPFEMPRGQSTGRQSSESPLQGSGDGASENVGMLLSQLSLAARFHEPEAIRSASLASPEQHQQQQRPARAKALGFPVPQQNRIRQVFQDTFESTPLEFVTLDTVLHASIVAEPLTLWIVNIASAAVAKRMSSHYLAVVASGSPVLFTGSRTALRALGIFNAPRKVSPPSVATVSEAAIVDPYALLQIPGVTSPSPIEVEDNNGQDNKGEVAASDCATTASNWDFLQAPWDRDELSWRLRKLSSIIRQQTSPRSSLHDSEATFAIGPFLHRSPKNGAASRTSEALADRQTDPFALLQNSRSAEAASAPAGF
jgi:hypothetical protein